MLHLFIALLVKQRRNMPKVLQFGPYVLYFWVGENGEPIHIHVAVKRPTEHATKIWLTSSGGCLLAHNRSKIPSKDLADILELVSLNHAYICKKWQEVFECEIEYYC